MGGAYGMKRRSRGQWSVLMEVNLNYDESIISKLIFMHSDNNMD
jgi:hypothetical protein